MPEGDTIHRLARRLAPVLDGVDLVAADLPRLVRVLPVPTTGVGVTARGKHLLMHFRSDGAESALVLHSHMRMTGSWRVSERSTPVRYARSRVRARLRTATHDVTCLDAPVVELLDEGALARHPVLSRLGPDLVLPDTDPAQAADRATRLASGDLPVVEVLLDQRLAAGIGNVYASELCFLCGVDPRTPWGEVAPAARTCLYEHAARLLRANLTTTRRTTVPDAPAGSLWVYERADRACRRCSTPIVVRRLGTGARPTWWCPSCQPAQ